MAEIVSLREFARRRGVTLAAVQKAVATGRVTAVVRDARGHLSGIDAVEGERQWNARTDPELALRTGTVVPPPAPEPLPAAGNADVGANEPRPDAGDTDEFRRDRARNEQLKRINGEIDLALRLKTLARAEDVRRAGFEASRAVQETLMRLPDRLAPLVAAETDPVRVHAMLSHEIRGALDALAERAADMARA